MARGFNGARLGVCLALCLLGLGAGCQPLYGGKPEQAADAGQEEAAQGGGGRRGPGQDDRGLHGRLPGRSARPSGSRPSLSNDLTDQGSTAMTNSDKATDPTAQAGLIRESIDKFRNALIKDPYNAEATLKLALAYDKVYRKGCALAMLKRLATLAANPRFSRTANAGDRLDQRQRPVVQALPQGRDGGGGPMIAPRSLGRFVGPGLVLGLALLGAGCHEKEDAHAAAAAAAPRARGAQGQGHAGEPEGLRPDRRRSRGQAAQLRRALDPRGQPARRAGQVQAAHRAERRGHPRHARGA